MLFRIVFFVKTFPFSSLPFLVFYDYRHAYKMCPININNISSYIYEQNPNLQGSIVGGSTYNMLAQVFLRLRIELELDLMGRII